MLVGDMGAQVDLPNPARFETFIDATRALSEQVPRKWFGAYAP